MTQFERDWLAGVSEINARAAAKHDREVRRIKRVGKWLALLMVSNLLSMGVYAVGKVGGVW